MQCPVSAQPAHPPHRFAVSQLLARLPDRGADSPSHSKSVGIEGVSQGRLPAPGAVLLCVLPASAAVPRGRGLC